MSKLVKAKGKPGHLAVNRLAVVLKEERVSNKNLAEVLGYEPATVSKWSTNTIQPPLSTFFRIALTVNRDLKDFFISTKDIEGEEKKKILKQLAIVAEKGEANREKQKINAWTTTVTKVRVDTIVVNLSKEGVKIRQKSSLGSRGFINFLPIKFKRHF